MSTILCIVDGMTDDAFRLEDYPHLSSMRLLRSMDTTNGQEAESLGCILRILGIPKVPSYLRGYVEALGEGVPVEENDLILRGSWFALDKSGCCCAPATAPKELPETEHFRYYCLGQYKSLLVFPGRSAAVSELVTYPPYVCSSQNAKMLCPKGCRDVTDLFHSQLTQTHCLIPWGQSVPAKMKPFPQKAAVVCGTSVVKGIARLLDMTLIQLSSATGDVDTDLDEKATATLHAADAFPFVLLHINGADEAAHRRDPEEKQRFLKKIDAAVLEPLLESGHKVYVMGDHGTDPVTGKHLGIKQPVFANSDEKWSVPR